MLGMQLEEGVRKREEHEGKSRHLISPRSSSGWNTALHGTASYERWVKYIALGSLGVWMIFVLFFWHTSVAPTPIANQRTTKIKINKTIPSSFPEKTTFIAFGDYGTGDTYQRSVALALENFTATMDPPPAFVLSTGDQIYDNGIGSADDALLSTNFEQMYTNLKLQVPWYVAIGNHDCEGSIDAMLQYAKKEDSLWYMPRRYYVVDRPVAPKTILRLVVIDACDLVCGREPRDTRCTEKMNEHSSAKTRKSQYEWIEETLSAGKPVGIERMWTIVMGHWGVYSFAGNGNTQELIDKLDPIMKKYKVHAYFNGHDHGLQHIRKINDDGSFRNYFVSGAGGYEIHPLKPKARSNPDLVHAAITHGFMSVQMTQTYFRVQLVDINSEILYTTDVTYR
ncbi:acid phosphatase [Plasmopara halstedii]|uniref:Acid phosphatase n=1 Tax=Plasmopara halstedii TaxID=4781 RepID=A0A0P1ART2_PLAHL|nr:acid phosphatase [Plasmopara halstedii]CEG43973.1 acid phosphatase [Plasmopara halstedii]|eukprot:XP_024580342.1 acid phosphatase [Plasmopara halstedii]